MKIRTLLAGALLGGCASTSFAAIIYLDLGAVAIPADVDGIYLNIVTGATANTIPGDFDTQPWINLFHGGAEISNSAVLRPWASSGSYDIDSHYFINLAPGSTVDASGLFVSGESGSYLHLGAAGDQFQSGVQGYLAFEYDLVGGGVGYGWLSFTPNDSGEGMSFDLAYSDTPGEALSVGAAIPEPSVGAALAGMAALACVAARRRRTA